MCIYQFDRTELSGGFDQRCYARSTSIKNAKEIFIDKVRKKRWKGISLKLTAIHNGKDDIYWKGKDPAMTYDFANIYVTPEYGKTVGWKLEAGSGALIITLLTISFQSIKAALINPVKSLRTV